MLLSLPDSVLYAILLSLREEDLCAVSAVNSELNFFLATWPSLWARHADRFAWRLLRSNSDHDAKERCIAAHRAEIGQRILIVGGSDADEHPMRKIFSYAVRKGEWEPQRFQTRSRDAACASCAPCSMCGGSRVFLVGGWDAFEHTASASADAFCVTDGCAASLHGRADTLPELPHGLCFGAAAHDAKCQLWVAGGGNSVYQGAQVHSAVLTLSSVGWRQAGRMRRPRCGLALAADPRGGALYACGGYGGGAVYEDTVEAFDAHTGTSALIRARMCAPRSGAGAAFGADGALYLAGGSRDGACMIADCERYDQREGTWQRLAALPTARGYLSATFALDGRLYVAGGSEDGGWALDLLEAYEPRKDRWVTLAPLPKCRANLAAVLVV